MRKILSIDGGGIKGVFPASFLASIEDGLGDNVSNYFDLIVGTSTGGIIALALGLGFSAREILTFYEELGQKIFRKSNSPIKLLRKIISSKYKAKPLREALEVKFGEHRLGESKKRLVIPSLNLETGEVYIYKTAHHQDFTTDYKELVVNVALATAAAPTYFPIHRSTSEIPLVDGGMMANNPVAVAVVEAMGVLKWEPKSFRLLSLSCTTEPLNFKLRKYFSSWITKKTLDVFMSAQSSLHLGMAKLLIGQENLFRISPDVPNNRFSLDGIKEINSLKGLGHSEARKALPELKNIFFDKHAETFRPYYELS